MDTKITRKIQAIQENKDPRLIREVNVLIGKYRLEAEKQSGYVKRYIHTEANEIERALRQATSR